MSHDASPEVLSFARRAVLRAIRGMTAEGAETAVDEDTLMRVVPLVECHDPGWLKQVLAKESLPLEGRKQIYAFTGNMPDPAADPAS